MRLSCTMLLFVATALPALWAQAAGPLATSVTTELLDPGSFAEWADGAERPIRPTDPKDKSHQPQWLIATTRSVPGHSGLQFGDSRHPGPRHLRLGFKEATPV